MEVKASLRISSDTEPIESNRSNTVVACLNSNRRIREMRHREFLRLVSVPDDGTGEIQQKVGISSLTKIAIRGYVFAFELESRNLTNAQQNIADLAHSLMQHSRAFTGNSQDAHIHGIFVPGQGYVRTLAHENSQTEFTTDHPLSAFKWNLLQGLATAKRIPLNWTPNIERYGLLKSKWNKPKNKTLGNRSTPT
jgi:hypothetical protein